MASTSFTHKGARAFLAYRANGQTYQANVRISSLSYNYGVSSEESHARTRRAFYPHRRVQGQFAVTVDCKGYAEFKQLMAFLRSYTTSLLQGALSNSIPVSQMEVSVPDRNFHRYGFITTGISDSDHVGSMVFSPELVFVSMTNPTDPVTSLLTINQVSEFHKAAVDSTVSDSFYPATVSSYNDKQTQLYDAVPGSSSASINDTVNYSGPGSAPTNGKDGMDF